MKRRNWQRYDEIGNQRLLQRSMETIGKAIVPNELVTLDHFVFFNTTAIRQALNLLSPFLGETHRGGGQEIGVYFNEIYGFGISSDRFWPKPKMGKWWTPLQEHFLPGVRKMPTEVKPKYWYGPDGKEFSSPEFDTVHPPYQMAVHMFDRALSAFACFVEKDQPCLEIFSRKYPKSDEEGYGAKIRTSWHGKLGDFLTSAEILERTLKGMQEQGYKVRFPSNQGPYDMDVRLIHPRAGLVIMRKHHPEIEVPEKDEKGHLTWKTKKLPKTLIIKNGILENLAAEVA